MARGNWRDIKAHVPDGKLWELHADMSERKHKTARVARKLRAGFDWSEGGFVQVPIDLPVGSKPVACLFLQVFGHLRSPSWKPRARFRHDAPFDVVERCRKHISHLIERYRHAPVLGPEWTDYLRRALDVLKEDPRIERLRQANAERYGGFDWNR